MKKYVLASIIGLVVLFSSFGPVEAAVGFTQGMHGAGHFTLVPSTRISFSRVVSPGNTFVLSIGISPVTTHVTSVTGGGVSWVKAASSNVQRDAEVWYGSATSGTSTEVVINVNDNLGTGYWNLTEWSGISSSSPVDNSISSSGISNIMATSGITPTTSGDLIVAMERNATNASFVSGPMNGFGLLQSGTPSMFNAAYLVGGLGMYSTSWTQGGVFAYETLLVAFKHQ